MFIATSYFYQIRFFKPYMIPLSTAVWDPKWYHEFKDQSHAFLDRNGVLNGLRFEDFAPGPTCQDLCRGPETCLTKDPYTCAFLQAYKKQIENISKDLIEFKIKNICDVVNDKLELYRYPMPVLILHETPQKLCSERMMLHEVLRSKGFEISELQYPIEHNYI